METSPRKHISGTRPETTSVVKRNGAKCCVSHGGRVSMVTARLGAHSSMSTAGRSPAFFAVLHPYAGVPGRAPPGRRQNDWEAGMLWTIFVILLVLWLLGMVSSYTFGGFIHILLVIALAIVLIRVIQGRRPV